ncbi:hypothetical protein [Methylobacterium bullatum]|uniref:hypothetical protein n=1 Tax=Methylobacterium bullatum TaxID=570505 RepID=UPI0030CC4171
MAQSEIKRLTPIVLDYKAAQADGDDRFLRHLRKQMRESILGQGVKNQVIKRSVYIVRLRGSFLIAYQKNFSPVLYIGRGDAPKRLASHLKSWLLHVHKFGSDTTVEVQIILPLRQGRKDFYKYVEGRLLQQHALNNGCIPLFNARREIKYGKDIDYNQTHEKLFRKLIKIGSGNRPWWAIQPTPANPFTTLYHKGTNAN